MPAFFGERLLLALCDSPRAPSVSDWRALSAAERAAAFRPLPADATPEARAIRATCRWLLVPPDKTIRHLLPPPVTNAPSALFPDDVKVTVRRHAEGAEE